MSGTHPLAFTYVMTESHDQKWYAHAHNGERSRQTNHFIVDGGDRHKLESLTQPGLAGRRKHPLEKP